MRERPRWTSILQRSIDKLKTQYTAAIALAATLGIAGSPAQAAGRDMVSRNVTGRDVAGRDAVGLNVADLDLPPCVLR